MARARARGKGAPLHAALCLKLWHTDIDKARVLGWVDVMGRERQ